MVTQAEGSASCCAGAGADRRLAAGNPGIVKPVGDGISELRIAYGPGCRVYYLQEDRRLVMLLCGGDKSSQRSDIDEAKRIAADWKSHGRTD